MDKLSPQQRHNNMAAIGSRNTKPELIVRHGLWKRGFRYRLNAPWLPGHPDLVLRKYRTCIFVNGCFWHGHNVQFPDELSSLIDSKTLQPTDSSTALESMERKMKVENSACCKIPHTNRTFWLRKIRRNQQRDVEQQHQLARLGWHCITVWECSLKPSIREETLTSLAYTLNQIWLQDHAVNVGYTTHDENDEHMLAAEDFVGYGQAEEIDSKE